MATILVNHLRVRTGPSVNAQEVAYYDAGQVIHSVIDTVENEGRTWLRYKASSGNIRYICLRDTNGAIYIRFGPQPIPIPIPKQTEFPDRRIQRWVVFFYVHV